ncbi:Asp-tRNA(Asn)/Glu-tRNA(Gln) amidotransferase subunit GatA [Ruminococcus flavefaciens]|uniref:Glutamyl-tRNA(Gln) amidotransferase subunit A n=1 Tax=Ruminococcus flavefaciens TaxID=1265 RepID=A0A1M7HCG7_RUMFL|nr:Asp-tRNA(Asn)/Glu-tRNA(Gln) amidotransferase subunit GatA [Ruminococcus flavefaciens]SHM26140.1 aspartyl/glutamyl-tRNA(Asn/Gln) amidotransferase subunit A [Ruminococcus flavefaciens]
MRLCDNTALELANMLRKKQCSAKEIYSDTLQRAQDEQNTINAYITFNDEAEKAAEAVDAMIADGRELPLIAGIPIAVKDNISTKGLRTTCASKMLRSYVPPYDAFAVEKLRNAGAVIIGKSNMDEFAMGSASDTGFFGAVRNPVDTNYSAGGSSGGSAASVSSGGAVLALGSDTGGSVRQPASLCGVVGFCPSYGAVSRYGLIPFASSFDRIGSIGRTVEDTYLLHNIINGADPKDVTSLNIFYPFNLIGELQGIRIGIVKELWNSFIDDDVRSSVMSAIRLMEKNGAVIKEISIPDILSAVKAYYVISSAEASSNLARYDGIRYGHRSDKCENLNELYKNSRSEGFGDEVKRRIMLGTFVLSEGFCDDYYKRAVALRKSLCAGFEEAFQQCDIIASPVYPKAGLKLGENKNPTEIYSADIFTVPSSMAGLPSISIPFGKNREGLPIGLQLIGGRSCDHKVFDIAYGYELVGGGCND